MNDADSESDTPGEGVPDDVIQQQIEQDEGVTINKEDEKDGNDKSEPDSIEKKYYVND